MGPLAWWCRWQPLQYPAWAWRRDQQCKPVGQWGRNPYDGIYVQQIKRLRTVWIGAYWAWNCFKPPRLSSLLHLGHCWYNVAFNHFSLSMSMMYWLIYTSRFYRWKIIIKKTFFMIFLPFSIAFVGWNHYKKRFNLPRKIFGNVNSSPKLNLVAFPNFKQPSITHIAKFAFKWVSYLHKSDQALVEKVVWFQGQLNFC